VIPQDEGATGPDVVDHVHLPQGPAVIQGRARLLLDEGAQRCFVARRGKGHVADVGIEIDLCILPGRRPDHEAALHDALPEAVEANQALPKEPTHAVNIQIATPVFATDRKLVGYVEEYTRFVGSLG